MSFEDTLAELGYGADEIRKIKQRRAEREAWAGLKLPLLMGTSERYLVRRMIPGTAYRSYGPGYETLPCLFGKRDLEVMALVLRMTQRDVESDPRLWGYAVVSEFESAGVDGDVAFTPLCEILKKRGSDDVAETDKGPEPPQSLAVSASDIGDGEIVEDGVRVLTIIADGDLYSPDVKRCQRETEAAEATDDRSTDT